jgi:MYXO-CTERM domain-containing protein
MERSVWLAAAIVSCLPRAALAFSIDSSRGPGCHEMITGDALIAVRATIDAADAVETDDADDEALIRDVPFVLPIELRDLVGATLLIGARDNDLQGRSPEDLSRLIALHGDDDEQDAHCLRAIAEDEPDGSIEALADCRAYLDERIDAALAGLGDDGLPDLAARTTVPVYLQFRDVTDVRLPVFWYEVGRALHTIEDAYTHTYRSDDESVTAVLNFVELAEKDYAESVDGPSHLSDMDDCTADAYRKARAESATTAATDFVLAMLQAETDGERRANTGAVLDRVLAFEPGCDASNGWCSAHERTYASSCATAQTGGFGAVLVALLAIAARRRRSVAAACVLVALLVPRFASAEPVTEKAREAFDRTPGVELRLGASIARPAIAPAVGGRYRINAKWVVGGDLEWNPWYSTVPFDAELGTLNLYGTLKREFPMESEPVRITTTLHLGASVLLFDLYGAPAGSVGPYFGMSLLGVEWRAFEHSYFVFDPGVAVPVPRVVGMLFAYYQYRITVGVRWGA